MPVPHLILRIDVAKALNKTPEAISLRIKNKYLPPLDVRQTRSRGWARDTIKQADPGLYRVLEAFYADQQAQG